MPILYALDFDGVICDSAIETAITGWKVAQTIWRDMPRTPPPPQLINDFRKVRPYLETGYEAILIMRLLQQGITPIALCNHYHTKLKQLIQKNQLNINTLKDHFGTTRDQWIKEDLAGWLATNPLFEGIQSALHRLKNENWVIITTKQERFVTFILNAHQVELHPDHIFGMERQQSKQDILLELKARTPKTDIIFIEDRLPTLIGICTHPQLSDLRLQLVDWGYNTAADIEAAQEYPIELISISKFIER